MGLTVDDIDKHYGTPGNRKPVNQDVLEKTQTALKEAEVKITGAGTVVPAGTRTLPPDAQNIASMVSFEPRSA